MAAAARGQAGNAWGQAAGEREAATAWGQVAGGVAATAWGIPGPESLAGLRLPAAHEHRRVSLRARLEWAAPSNRPDRTSCRPHPSAERDGEPGSGQGLAGGAGSSPRPPCSRACFLFPPMSRHAGSTHARAHGRNDSLQRPMKRAGCASRPATPAAVLPPTVTAGLPLRTGGRRSRASPQRHWSAALGRIRRFPGAPVPRGGSELCWRMGTCLSPPRASWEAPPAQGPLGLGAAGTVPAACQGRTPGRPPAWRARFTDHVAPAPAKGQTAPPWDPHLLFVIIKAARSFSKVWNIQNSKSFSTTH